MPIASKLFCNNPVPAATAPIGSPLARALIKFTVWLYPIPNKPTPSVAAVVAVAATGACIVPAASKPPTTILT